MPPAGKRQTPLRPRAKGPRKKAKLPANPMVAVTEASLRAQTPIAPPEFVSEATLKAEELPPLVVVPARDAAVVDALTQGKTPVQAVAAAGMPMTRANAEEYCGAVLKRYNEPMQRALIAKGVTLERLAEKIAEQLDAQRYLRVRGEDGTELQAVPDNAARQGAVGLAFDVFPGIRAPKQLEVETRSLEMILMRIQVEEQAARSKGGEPLPAVPVPDDDGDL